MRFVLTFLASLALACGQGLAADKPHIIFVMADDMGWGQTGYRNHPVLKTPNLDAMAANGLRFERFYAGGPVCSPTRLELYDLVIDPKESRDLSAEKPEVFAKMKQQLLAWDTTMDASFAGKDYPEGKVSPPDPESVSWHDTPQYQPFLAEWKQRWEYKSYLNRPQAQASPGGKKKRQK